MGEKNKNVLLVATVQSHIAQFHKPLVEVLHEHGCEVHVVAKDNLAEKNGLKLDFVERVFDVPFSRSPKSIDNIKAYKQLKRIINEGQYDVIHCNTPMGGIVTRLAARKARKYGTKVYYTAHGFHFYKGAPKKNWLIYYPIEKCMARLTDVLITITKEDYELAKTKFKTEVRHIHGVGVDEKRYYAVDENEKRRLRREMGYDEEQKIILCVGELLPNKNQRMAIHMMREIVRKYPNALLLLAGNGPEKVNLEQEIFACGMQKNIRMLGYVTNLQDYQHVVDVCVSCSKREGLPLNIVEAMLSKTSVVASYNRGHRELISDNKTGFLVFVNDDKIMAKQVMLLLENQDIRATMVQNAFEYASNYNFTNVKRELEKVYFDYWEKTIYG